MQKKDRRRYLASCSQHEPCVINRRCKWSKANMTVTAGLSSLLSFVSFWPSADISILSLSGCQMYLWTPPPTSPARAWPLLYGNQSFAKWSLPICGDLCWATLALAAKGFCWPWVTASPFQSCYCSLPDCLLLQSSLNVKQKKWIRWKCREMNSQAIMVEIV